MLMQHSNGCRLQLRAIQQVACRLTNCKQLWVAWPNRVQLAVGILKQAYNRFQSQPLAASEIVIHERFKDIMLSTKRSTAPAARNPGTRTCMQAQQLAPCPCLHKFLHMY